MSDTRCCSNCRVVRVSTNSVLEFSLGALLLSNISFNPDFLICKHIQSMTISCVFFSARVAFGSFSVYKSSWWAVWEFLSREYRTLRYHRALLSFAEKSSSSLLI